MRGFLLLLAAISLPPSAARAESYWGPIPGAADSADSAGSARALYRDTPRSVWEGIVYWPVRIAGEPLVLLADGVGEAVEFLDEKKVIDRVGRWLGPRRGPFGVVIRVEAGGLGGFGGGLGIEHDAFFGQGNLFRLSGSTSVNGDHRATLGLRFPSASGDHLELGAGYRLRGNARYFGFGPETEARDESFYRRELFWAGAGARGKFGRRVFVEGDLLYSSAGAGEPRDDTPSISTVFAGELPYGFGFHSYGVSLGLQLAHVDERETGRSTRGGSRRVRVEYFRSTDKHPFDMWSYRAELQHFLTLWHPYRVLALRGHGSWLDPVGGDPIPYQRLLTNDTPDALRGYQSFRFRDRGFVALDAEYRFPVWTNKTPAESGLDLYPLADWGQVFGDADQISVRNMTFSYGLGLRLESARGFVARVEWARSEEETTFRLRGDQLFQFGKLGLLHGRDPIPAR